MALRHSVSSALAGGPENNPRSVRYSVGWPASVQKIFGGIEPSAVARVSS